MRWTCGLWLFVLAAPVAADPPPNYPFLAYDEGLRRAQQESKRVFLYFGRYGCGWCEKTNREAFSSPQVRRLYIEHYVLVYVDSESGRRLTLPSGERITELELGARFKAYATPVFVYLETDGRQILKVSGVQTVADLLEFDRYVHGEHYRSQTFPEFSAGQRK
jgi:thioredoxin-related protein